MVSQTVIRKLTQKQKMREMDQSKQRKVTGLWLLFYAKCKPKQNMSALWFAFDQGM